MWRCLTILALTLAVLSTVHAERIWIEGEEPIRANFSSLGEVKGALSGDRMLRLWEDSAPGAEGYVAEYRFVVKGNRDYRIWASPSLPPVTSSFWWRVDSDKYTHITDDSNVREWRMFGASEAMCWMDLGRMRLTSGEHTISFRVNERRRDLEHAYLMYLDAILITDEPVEPSGLVTREAVASLPVVSSSGVHPVNREGKPGRPMVMGSSVMSVGQSLLLKSLGFDLLQTDSAHLYTNETSPGVWDWSEADRGLEVCRKAGVRWQYFPHFHWVPEWRRRAGDYVPIKCIGHGRELSCISLWSPQLRESMERGFTETAKRYGSGDRNVNAIYLAVYGDFGEPIMPIGFHPDEIKLFGENGAGHGDWWCADDCARSDFREKMASMYGSLDRLNAAWGTSFASVGEVSYPLPFAEPRTAGERRRWLDFVDWQYDSMSEQSLTAYNAARRSFPRSSIVVPLGGGDENLVYAQDNTGIPRILRGTDAQIRSTHGGYLPVPQNYGSMLRRIATACKFYKQKLWTEPPSTITAEGEVGRIFEAISCGSYGYWEWGANPVKNADVFRKYRSFLTQETPVVDVALLHPQTDLRLHPEIPMPGRFMEAAAAIRDVMDYDILDERLIDDGALSGYRVLALLQGSYVEESALRKIEQWVRAGGVVVSYDYGPVSSVEGDQSVWRRLFGIPSSAVRSDGGIASRTEGWFLAHASRPRVDGVYIGLADGVRSLATVDGRPAVWVNPVGKGYAVYYAGSWESRKGYYELLRDAAYNLHALDSRLRDAAEIDGAWDGVYCTLLPSGEAIVYNAGKSDVKATVGGRTVEMAPCSLASVMTRE